MAWIRCAFFGLAWAMVGVACSSSEGPTPVPILAPGSDAATPVEEAGVDAGVDAPIDAPPDAPLGAANLRIVAANISSGAALDYTAKETQRLLQGLEPDVALLQELKVGGNTKAEVDAFVTTAFGASYTYYREPDVEIPNGVVSRFPIETSGRWVDPQVANRSFVYAKITLPNARPLWAVSVHFLTSGSSPRSAEASALVAKIGEVVPPADYLVIGGDLNTDGRAETCVKTLGSVVQVGAPFPVDNFGNDNTNAPRTKAFDWLLADPDLAAVQVPVKIGAKTFTAGLVFDSRVYEPLADVAPIQATDSAATNMQHMPVVKDFHVGP